MTRAALTIETEPSGSTEKSSAGSPSLATTAYAPSAEIDTMSGSAPTVDLAENGGCGIRGVRVEEHEVAGVGLHRGLEGDHAEPVGAHGDGVRDAVGADRELLRDVAGSE